MTLDFLTPRGPTAQSPLMPLLRAAGASFEVRGGWQVAVRVGDPAAEAAAVRDALGWADFSHIRKTATDGSVVLGDEADGVDVTTQYGAILIAGPQARGVLARFCALDLRPHVAPVGSSLSGSIARTPGVVHVQAEDRYLLLCGSALSEYLWDVVSDAGSSLGGRPVGVDALDGAAARRAEASLRA